MKYFSPSVLDGSITTAKLADDAVDAAKIDRQNASQAGSIGVQSRVSVGLNSLSFFPDIEGDIAAPVTLNMTMLADFKAVPAAAANIPIFDLLNEDTGSARNYSVAWEFIGI